jgi:hypothetical protein
MKGTEQFQKTIKAYLDDRALIDAMFAESYAKPNKSIEECCNFIFTQVQKSGCCGFADDEIYGMAVHYYDEDNLGEIKPIQGQVVVNHKVELTEEEIAEARREAKERVVSEEIARLRKPQPKPVQKKEEIEAPTLF